MHNDRAREGLAVTVAELPEIARLYSLAPHQPYHPSYRAFVTETLKQFRGLLANNWAFTRTTEKAVGSELAYTTSDTMFQDIDRKVLHVWTGGQDLALNSTMAQLVTAYDPYMWDYRQWTVNEVFRAVHDVLGHGAARSPFETMEGEIAAWEEHSRQYSEQAQGALNGETLGQLAYYHVTGEFVQLQECRVLEL